MQSVLPASQFTKRSQAAYLATTAPNAEQSSHDIKTSKVGSTFHQNRLRSQFIWVSIQGQDLTITRLSRKF